MDTLNAGTKEIISVYLTDRLKTVTSISAADYKVVTEDESGVVIDWEPVEHIDHMRIDVLVDTTAGGSEGDPWAEGTYKLYVRPNVAPEAPIVGPFEFGVSQ